MRKPFTMLCAIIPLLLSIGHPLEAEEVDSVQMHLAVISTEEAGAPQLIGRKVLFSYEPPKEEEPVRRVGIAFAHENYTEVYAFSRNRYGVFVFTYDPPQELDSLTYRLVVDGIWTNDPNAPRSTRTPEGILLSSLSLPEPEQEERGAPQPGGQGEVTFTYRSEDANRVAIAGTFNRWNPYLHVMREHPRRDGLFTISLPLSQGTHYYYFVVDGRRTLDPDNPKKASSSNGGKVSVYNVGG